MSAYILSVVGAVISIAFIVEMLRRGQLREKYAVLWLCVGVAVLVIGVAPALLTGAADLLGVAVPANLLFFVAGLALLMISVQQSSEISRLEEETRTLAEEVALLRLRQERLEESIGALTQTPTNGPGQTVAAGSPEPSDEPGRPGG